MSNVFVRISHDLMVDILSSNVRDRRKINGYSTYTDKKHHGIRADMLASKWWVVLHKAKCTLQNTIQDNVISDLKTIACRYRTDFLSERLRRLNCRFYHRWELPVPHYHKIIVIYPYLFLVSINQLFS